MSDPLNEPRYSQPDVLKVTRLRPAVLQTWSNRSFSHAGSQNPGRGKKRLYSKIDVIKLSIMRRLADLRMEFSKALEIAEAAADDIQNRGIIGWNDYIFLRPDDATEKAFRLKIVGSSSMSKLASYGVWSGDPRHMRVSEFVEPDRHLIPRRKPVDDQEADDIPIDEDLRKFWARKGIHAEPVIVFPIGEIVRGALLQMEALDEGDASDV